MEKLMMLIDKYLVPIYRKDGIVVTLVVVAAMVGLALLAMYLGLGEIVRGLLQ